MEKDRSTKIMVIIALLVGVVGLSIGFATFSTMITIKSSAKVTPSGDKFTVDFSKDPDDVNPDPIPPAKYPPDSPDVGGTDAVIDNSDIHNPVISNLSATFTEPGQKVEYTVYAYNSGEYLAYLKSITFKNVDGQAYNRSCSAAAGTSPSLVTAACDDIVLSVKPGSMSPVTSTQTGITNHTIAKGKSEPIVITIEYLTGGDRADGDFTVSFGDVTLEYRTAD